jgi:hypothetical protein
LLINVDKLHIGETKLSTVVVKLPTPIIELSF